MRTGRLFFWVPGFTRDGREFAPNAIERLATALVIERPRGLDVPLDVDRARLGTRRDAYRGSPLGWRPPTTLVVSGVTGTNGETVSAFLLREIIWAARGQ